MFLAARAPCRCAPVNSTLGLMTDATQSLAANCADRIAIHAETMADSILWRAQDTVDFTRLMTLDLCALISERGGRPWREYRLQTDRRTKDGKLREGMLDIFAHFSDRSKLAIEIDRGNKQWSLEKLHIAASRLQAEAVWIRWRGKIKFTSCAPVRFVDVSHIGNHVSARGGKPGRGRGTLEA